MYLNVMNTISDVQQQPTDLFSKAAVLIGDSNISIGFGNRRLESDCWNRLENSMANGEQLLGL